ncbi:MAG: hypothetical protein H6740_29400, partial [Alphaproteobacteria bacterium]|nr:hypothetical protein [Alphaproteobacteria bacterium]
SHGAGRSRWTAAEQMEQQGRVKLDRRTMLDPVEVGEKAFLPGGERIHIACFGAGTPKETAFQAWLDQLYQLDHYATSPNVRRTLAKERPFVAATPMAALANPRGPLAVFAHADLAFSYGYAKLPGQENLTLAGGQGSVANPFEGGQPFVSNTLQHLGRGQRAGFAMHELDRVVQWLETALTSDADQDAQSTNEMAGRVLELSHQPPGQGGELIPEAIRDAAKLALSEVGNPKKVTLPLIAARARMTPDELRAALGQRFTEFAKAGEAMVAISHKWMARNDVRAFILLGDPAVDLALEKTRPKKDVEDWGFPMPPRPEPEPTPTPASSFGAAIAPEVAEKIVMDLLSGEASPRQASRQHGLTVEQVNELERVYTEAGKRALERLLKG